MSVADADGMRTAADTTPSAGTLDLDGWSALPLLGNAGAAGRPWLFLMSPSRAWLSRSSPSAPGLEPVQFPWHQRWRFDDGMLDGLVIDGDAVGRECDDARLGHVASEAVRTTRPTGNLLVVCGEGSLSSWVRSWRTAERPSAARWRQVASSLGLSAARIADVRLDGHRITDVALADGAGSIVPTQSGRDHRFVLRLASVGDDRRSTLAAIVASASAQARLPFRIDRVAVRKIGKTAVFLTAADGSRSVMRIPRSEIARARAKRNHETLVTLHRSSLPQGVASVVPAAVAQGSHEGYPYYVETCVRGGVATRQGSRRSNGWLADAADFITALHNATVKPSRLDHAVTQRLVLEPFATVQRACPSPAHHSLLDRLAAACERALAGRLVPLVQTHGDFTEGNCLFDAAGCLTGVVDWELAQADGLPLVDFLQLMPVPGETGAAPRWQRFDCWMALRRDPSRVLADPVMGGYARTLGLTADVISSLIAVHWVTHVADRINARGTDERWMRLRVWQPLHSLESGVE